jgi:hypothetical protein
MLQQSSLPARETSVHDGRPASRTVTGASRLYRTRRDLESDHTTADTNNA